MLVYLFLTACFLAVPALELTGISQSFSHAGMSPLPLTPKSSEVAGTLEQLLDRMRTERGGYELGVYVPGEFAFPIVDQPEDDALYVSVERNLVTDFRAAEQNGIRGLLAHNFLAGAFFYDLEIGEEIWIVDSEEKMQGYQVTEIEQFQKIEKNDTDVFIDLNTRTSMSGSEVFDRFYTGEPHLTLQTCLESEGDLSWGMTFIVAEPIP